MAGYDIPKPQSRRWSVAFFGTGDFGVPTLERLILAGLSVRAVITSPDRPAGRGRHIHHSAIKDLAMAHDIPLLQPNDVNDPYMIEQIRQYGAEIGIVIAYGQKISGKLIDAFAHGILNLHGSLLPKYRGAAPINWAIINGERDAGITVMQINERIDAGRMLVTSSTPIGPVELADELHDRLSQLGPDAMIKTLDGLHAGTLTSMEQNPADVTRARKLSKADSPIDWAQPANVLACRIRGLWPWPGAKSIYTPIQGKPTEVTFAHVHAIDDAPPATTSPGTILDDHTIACGVGRLCVLDLLPAGGKRMEFSAFVNGRHVQIGDRFVSTSADPATPS